MIDGSKKRNCELQSLHVFEKRSKEKMHLNLTEKPCFLTQARVRVKVAH